MSDSRLTAFTIAVAAALLAVIGVGAVVGTHQVGQRLTPPADRALARAGLDDVTVQLHGRDATVRGGTLDDLRDAAAAVARVPGVRRATVDTAPGAVVQVDTTRPWLTLRRSDGDIRLRGAVPSATESADLKVAAARAFGVPVRGDLRIDPLLPSVPWTDRLPDAFADLTGVRDLRLVADGDRVRVDGTTGQAAARDDLRTLLQTSLTGLDVDLAVIVAVGGGEA